MSLAGIRSQDEQDYPLPIQESLTVLPFSYGGNVTLTAGQASDIIKVSDLRRFENMDSVVIGTATAGSGADLLTDANADYINWGVVSGDEVVDSTMTSYVISAVTATTLSTVGHTWADTDTYHINKRASHPTARATEIRKFSIVTDQLVYVRFDAQATSTLYHVEVGSTQTPGYYSEHTRVVSRISAIGVSSSSTPTVSIIAWGI